MKRTCTRCHEEKPLTAEFFGYQVRKLFSQRLFLRVCKVCNTKARKAAGYRRNARQPDKKRADNLRSRYGITVAEYDAILARQGGGCGICGAAGKLNVDHEHETGRVRGLLCTPCNVLLGLAKDNTDTLRRAIAYLVSKI